MDKDSSIYFRFLEYDSYVMNDEKYVTFKIKDSEGLVHRPMVFFNYQGYMLPMGDESQSKEDVRNEVIDILKKGNIISVAAEAGSYSLSNYIFDMDITGYDKAIECLK